MAVSLRPNPPPPLKLNGTLERWKKRLKKSYFFLNGPALYPLPLLMARPFREKLFFFTPSFWSFFSYFLRGDSTSWATTSCLQTENKLITMYCTVYLYMDIFCMFNKYVYVQYTLMIYWYINSYLCRDNQPFWLMTMVLSPNLSSLPVLFTLVAQIGSWSLLTVLVFLRYRQFHQNGSDQLFL